MGRRKQISRDIDRGSPSGVRPSGLVSSDSETQVELLELLGVGTVRGLESEGDRGVGASRVGVGTVRGRRLSGWDRCQGARLGIERVHGRGESGRVGIVSRWEGHKEG